MSQLKNILLAWLGLTDIKASKKFVKGVGPIAQAVIDRKYEKVILISNSPKIDENIYTAWFENKTKTQIDISHFDLSSPTEYKEIFEAVKIVLDDTKTKYDNALLTYHLSSGTPAMSAVWILMSKSDYPGELIDSSIQQGVRTISLPFEVYASYIKEDRRTDKDIFKILDLGEEDRKAFQDILHKSDIMKIQIARAVKIAKHDFPVIIQGESGTGKELFARAIHNSSKRKNAPCKIINCGAIPDNLIEAELFGYEKGAFTGANTARKGIIESADEGTLFLDEIGEMPLDVQVKLLRTLQEKTLRRIGSNDEIKVDFRIIAATNRNLVDEIQKGNFREDLFHRLAIGLINLPPLRERKEDINMLIDYFLSILNKSEQQCKKISISVRSFILNHDWPGNIRELDNTIKRIFIWSYGDIITEKDVEENIISIKRNKSEDNDIMTRDFNRNFSINDILNEVESHYIKEAFKITDKKTKAAEIIGYSSHQTLINRMKKLGL